MILLNDFKNQPEELIQEEIKILEKVVRSGWYILGQEVKQFEANWANICQLNYAVGVGNGMDAIEIGLRCLNIGKGDEVITTPMTAFATVLAIIRAGATPVLADINPTTALLDLESVERVINPKTKAILLVHIYGQIKEMDKWLKLCQKYDLKLLEDCAQSHLATWEGKTGGSFDIWGAYSFYPTKNLGAIGDGGALVTNSEVIAQKAKVLRNYGQSERYHHPELGLNSRLDELQAALLSVRLKWLEKFTQKRREIAQKYFKEINNPKIKLLAKPEALENHVYHLFVILCNQREELMTYLKQKEISSLIHYPIPIHYQKPCQELKRDTQGLINSENHANQCLSIPCHPQMNDDEINRVIEVLNEY